LENGKDADLAARQLYRIGFDKIVGWITTTEAQQNGLFTARLERMNLSEFNSAKAVVQGEIIDVRTSVLMTKDDYLEGFANHLLTFLPERRGSGGIERISTYAFANGADADVVWYDPPDVAVLAVLTADRVSGRDNPCPD
jgi:hypothetical protein